MEKKSHLILKVYASSTDTLGSRLLYEELVHRAREAGLSGATVFRGVMGYGLSSHIHSSRFWELTEKLPVVIEIIDTKENIEAFYSLIGPDLEALPKGCLVTVTPLDVVLHKYGKTRDRSG